MQDELSQVSKHNEQKLREMQEKQAIFVKSLEETQRKDAFSAKKLEKDRENLVKLELQREFEAKELEKDAKLREMHTKIIEFQENYVPLSSLFEKEREFMAKIQEISADSQQKLEKQQANLEKLEAKKRRNFEAFRGASLRKIREIL